MRSCPLAVLAACAILSAGVAAGVAAGPLAAQDAGPLPDPAATLAPPVAAHVLQGIAGCWAVAPESPAAQVAVTVEFALDRDGRVAGDIALLMHSDGSDAAVEGAFQAARRAILRCSAAGLALPQEDYDRWRVVQMTLDPRELTIR